MGMACGDAVGLWTWGRFFYSYFLMALPPLCLLCLPGLLALFDGKKGWIPISFQIMSVLTCLLCTAFALVAVFWIEIAPNQAVEHKAARAVSDYLAERNAAIGCLCGVRLRRFTSIPKRVIGTRFVFCNYHTGKIWGGHLTDVDATGTESHIVPLAWTELLNDLQNNRPLLLWMVPGSIASGDRHPVSRYPQLAEVIEQNYSQVALVSGVPIYRRKDQIGSPSVRPSAQP